MGMFTWVKPHPEILPVEFREIKEWQTKDVVEPEMETLELTADGKLVYIWYEREYVEDEESFFGFWLKPTTEHRDELDFHGDMIFYAYIKGRGAIDLKARFTEGKLQWVREM